MRTRDNQIQRQERQMTLAVNEVFGPTIQGEGPSIGHPATFLRLAGCNLACVWCDTPYSWDYRKYDRIVEVHKMTPDQVIGQITDHANPNKLLIVSGGEPMLQQIALTDVLDRIPSWSVHIETAGTIVPLRELTERVNLFVVSPKLYHSGNSFVKRRRPEPLVALSETGKVAWKFVCQVPSDLSEVDDIVNGLRLLGPVYIMPEGYERDVLTDRMRELVGPVIERGWRLTPRLHVDIWGPRRGV